MDELWESQPLVHVHRLSNFISGKAAIPPPTVSKDRYAKTRASEVIWFIE